MKNPLGRTLYSLIPLILLIFTFVNASAIGKPKFSGTWELNKDESKVSQQMSLAPSKVVITQNKNDFHVVRYVNIQGYETTIDEKFTLDGKECKNAGFQGSTKLSTVSWSDDGKSLIVATKIESSYGELKTKQVYSFEKDKLKVISTMSSPNGDMSETWILNQSE
jgi:hypothetical protein